MSDTKPVLSIVIPIYNDEKHLEECLESLINQEVSFDKYEIICIDDGSTDNSNLILEKYNKQIDNLTVFHQNNSGVSVARNRGLELAKGTYIWFVDADDFIPLTVYSQIVAGTNFKVCFIDRKSEIPSVQEVMVHVPLPTSGRNGLVFKIILKMERHSREIHNLNDESFALAGNHLTKELERTDEKFVKINNLYKAESMENIFYIVNAQTEKGEHQYVFTEDKKTGELDYINKIR